MVNFVEEERSYSGNVSIYPFQGLEDQYVIQVARHFDCETWEFKEWRVFWSGGELTSENVLEYARALLKAADIAEEKNADAK